MADTHPKAAWIAAYQEAVLHFTQALARCQLDEVVGLNGPWRVWEVVGHLAACDEEAVRRISALLAGAPTRTYEIEAFTTAALASIRRTGQKQVRARQQAATRVFLAILSTVPEEAFREQEGVLQWVRAQIRHYHEHATDLEEGTTILPET